MSIREAREQMKQAQRHLEAATKAIESVSHAIPPYSPRVGDVISVEWRGRWAAIVVPSILGNGWCKVFLDLDPKNSFTFYVASETGRTVQFLRRATPAEMAQFGLVERDVTPDPVTTSSWIPRNYESWMLADNHAIVARDGETTYLVRKGDVSAWSVSIDRGLGITHRASCDDKAQAMDVAQAMAGKALEWKRWF